MVVSDNVMVAPATIANRRYCALCIAHSTRTFFYVANGVSLPDQCEHMRICMLFYLKAMALQMRFTLYDSNALCAHTWGNR